VLPPKYLATQTRPLGLLLIDITVAMFALPNTYQIFVRFEPALGVPEERQAAAAPGPARRDDRALRAAAFACQPVPLLSVLR
jgi:hypothetical protein